MPEGQAQAGNPTRDMILLGIGISAVARLLGSVDDHLSGQNKQERRHGQARRSIHLHRHLPQRGRRARS